MFVRSLRRLSVRGRIIGGFAILLMLLILSAPIVVVDHLALTNRVQQLSNIDARSDRMLLLSLSRILSSRVNLMRYVNDLTPSPSEALSDVDQAGQYLEVARSLINVPDQQTALANILSGMVSYRTLITEVQNARNPNSQQDVAMLLNNAYRLEFDLEQQINAVVSNSENRVNAANTAAIKEAQQRLIIIVVGYIGIIALAVLSAAVIQRSITRPIAELREGADSFRQVQQKTSIPSEGTDELSVLAQTFNQLTDELAQSYSTLEQQVIDRTAALKRRSTQLETATRVSHEAASELDLQQLLTRTTALISESFGFYHVGIFLLDEHREWAILHAASSEGGQKMLARGHRLKVGQVGIVGYVTGKGEARIAQNVGQDIAYFDNPDLPTTRSEVALPLRARGEVIGALDVQDLKEAAFSDEDVAILQSLADQIALAISNARLFQQSEESVEQLRRIYGDLSRQAWEEISLQKNIPMYRYVNGEIIPSENMWLPEMSLAVKEDRRVTASESLSDPSHDLVNAQPHTLAAAISTHPAVMAIPIKSLGQTVGVLSLRRADTESSADPREWTADEIALVETITEQLGIALESARLYEASQLQAGRERLISDITTSMRESLDVDTVLRIAVREVKRALNLAEVEVRLEAPPSDDAGSSAREGMFS